MKKTLLIFGVSGFTGRHLCRYLKENVSEADINIVGVVLRDQGTVTSDVDHLEVVNSLDNVAVLNLLSKIRPTYILNLIGLFRAASYEEFMQTNVEISRNILQGVVDLGAFETRLLFIGSAAEYGAVTTNPISEQDSTIPISLYGLSKAFQTEIVQFYHRVYQVQSVIARTFNLTGQGISASLSVGNFQKQIDAAQDGDTIKVGNLNAERDFLDVEAAVRLYMELLLNGNAGEVYNVCSGKPVRIGDLLAGMIASSGKTLLLEVSHHLLRDNDISRIYGSRAKLDEFLTRISEGRTHHV